MIFGFHCFLTLYQSHAMYYYICVESQTQISTSSSIMVVTIALLL